MKRLLFCIIKNFAIKFLFLLLTVLPVFAQPQDAASQNIHQKEKKSSKNKFDLYSEISAEYLDNVFTLSESQKNTMGEKDPRDRDSGRYLNMDSISDYILTARIGMKFNFDSSFGRKLKAKTWIKYNYYFKNEKSRYHEAGIELKQSIVKDGDLILEGKLLDGYFKKNYILDFYDLNGNNNISKDERIYWGASYDEYEGSISYDYRIIKKKKNKLGIGLNIKPFLGYGVRKYNQEFNNRDRHINLAGIEFNFDSELNVSLDITYKYENVDCPDGDELVLVNEENLGYDINGDGELDRNAALFTTVSRSSNRNSLKIMPSVKLGKNLLLFAGYRLRKTKYKSGNPLDLEHYGQSVYRRVIKAGIEYRIIKSLYVQCEYNKLDDEDDEYDDDSYVQEGYVFTVQYTFK